MPEEMPEDIDVRLVYTTVESIEEGQKLGRTLVDGRLAACINLIPQMSSIYRWQGKVESAQECVVIVKTSAASVAKVRNRIHELHSYDEPCIVEIPVTGGSPQYLKWICENSLGSSENADPGSNLG